MWFWQWDCHGLRWQLIPSRRYPERDGWHPICPFCGQVPKRQWHRSPRGKSNG